MHLQEKILNDLDTENVAQRPIYHVNYAPSEFEVAMSNPLGGDTFTRKYII